MLIFTKNKKNLQKNVRSSNERQISQMSHHGERVYRADKAIGEHIRKGDQFYLDGEHRNHLEVFSSIGQFKHVINFDGSLNDRLTKKAKSQGRVLK